VKQELHKRHVLLGPEMLLCGNRLWERCNIFKGFCRNENKRVAGVPKFSLAIGLMLITDEPLQLTM
jgi:hypothetical protein